MLDLATAAAYFHNRYGAAEWGAASEDEKRQLLATAEADISAELSGAAPDYSMPAAVGAVCEQALFLLTDPNALRDTSRIASESVEGIGSRTYRTGNGSLLSVRAERFVNQLRCMVPGTVRVARG